MRIGDLAAQTNVSTQTIRFYERRGLLKRPPRTPAGYRDYPKDAVRLIEFIRRSQELGYGLQEIGELLRLRDQRSGNGKQVRALAEKKLRSIDEKLRALQRMRREIRKILDSCGCGAEHLPDCPLLEKLEQG
jgi:DNA-binding transcriptional MerR regulator